MNENWSRFIYLTEALRNKVTMELRLYSMFLTFENHLRVLRLQKSTFAEQVVEKLQMSSSINTCFDIL